MHNVNGDDDHKRRPMSTTDDEDAINDDDDDRRWPRFGAVAVPLFWVPLNKKRPSFGCGEIVRVSERGLRLAMFARDRVLLCRHKRIHMCFIHLVSTKC